MPTFRYFLLDRLSPVEEGTADWQALLPASRHGTRHKSQNGGQEAATRGAYFDAVRTFLEEPPQYRLADAVSRRIHQPVSHTDIEAVDIFLEKHGQYYHPARVEAVISGRMLSFVVNAAVTETGKAMIETDFNNMMHINQQFPYRFLPDVYHLGEIQTDTGQPTWILFLGQWLEDYHEFHLQRSAADGAIGVVVWDPNHGLQHLIPQQVAMVYRLVARIVTATYNLLTSEHIAAWHHAAGDFVIRIEPTPDLKLVTVRQYRPLFEGPMDDTETVFQTLLLFLLNLTVRTRIDRDNGTGDLLWSAELAVPATIDGFFDGLALQVQHGLIPEELPALFRTYLGALTGEDLADLLVALVEKNITSSTESELVHRHLKMHIRALTAAI